MTSEKTGQIVWHDLFTDGADTSRTFYAAVADWHYIIERAEDFAWGGGERDFILALSDDEAGAGFVVHNCVGALGWVPYVEVTDVDAVARMAADLDGTVLKSPFEVPGVGRNCLLHDPAGAIFGICTSRHTFPIPKKQFGFEVYQAHERDFPADFYGRLFDWSTLPSQRTAETTGPIVRAENQIGFWASHGAISDQNNSWLPSVRVNGQLSKALLRVQEEGGSAIHQLDDAPHLSDCAFVLDPNGAPLYLVAGR